MNHLLTRKKSSASLRKKQSEGGSVVPSSITPSNEKPRDVKSAPYKEARYKALLSTKDSFMDESDLGIAKRSRDDLGTLLSVKQSASKDSLFRNDLFKSTCQKVRNRNKARVIQDIARLIVPSAETLATFGAKQLEILIESVNEG
jgi:hypothetical protein